MFDLIEKLRQKPDRVKKQISFFTSLFFAGIIFVIWLSVIYPDFRKSEQRKEIASKNEPSPIGTFLDTFSMGVATIGSQFSEIVDLVTSVSSTSTYYSTTTVDLISSTTEPVSTSTMAQ